MKDLETLWPGKEKELDSARKHPQYRGRTAQADSLISCFQIPVSGGQAIQEVSQEKLGTQVDSQVSSCAGLVCAF